MAARIAAWRFGGFGGGAEPAGPATTPAGGIAMAEGDAAVRQSIMLLIATRPGERVMRPDYGCDLQRLVFEPGDETTAGLAIHYVRRALQRFEPRAEILHLDARPSDGAVLLVTLEYRVRATQRTDSLTISLDLAGG